MKTISSAFSSLSNSNIRLIKSRSESSVIAFSKSISVASSPNDVNRDGFIIAGPIQDDKKYYDWQEKVYSKLKPKNKVVTIVVSNRRFQRKTIPKHQHITDIMKNLG